MAEHAAVYEALGDDATVDKVGSPVRAGEQAHPAFCQKCSQGPFVSFHDLRACCADSGFRERVNWAKAAFAGGVLVAAEFLSGVDREDVTVPTGNMQSPVTPSSADETRGDAAESAIDYTDESEHMGHAPVGDCMQSGFTPCRWCGEGRQVHIVGDWTCESCGFTQLCDEPCDCGELPCPPTVRKSPYCECGCKKGSAGAPSPKEYPDCPDCTARIKRRYRKHEGMAQQIVGLESDRDEWRKSCIHAKAQRDRAIFKVHNLGSLGWHPDLDGAYHHDN